MLVEVADLQKYMDIKFSNRQVDAAGFVLGGLQSELETVLRRPVELAEYTETYVVDPDHLGLPTTSFFYDTSLDTTGSPRTLLQNPYPLRLRNSPVISIDSVTISNPEGEATEVLVEGLDFFVRRWGIDIRAAAVNEVVEITYTAGLDGPQIPYFKLLILRAATREMQNMHDDVVGVKDLNTRNVAPLQTGFTPEEIESLRRWRRFRI